MTATPHQESRSFRSQFTPFSISFVVRTRLYASRSMEMSFIFRCNWEAIFFFDMFDSSSNIDSTSVSRAPLHGEVGSKGKCNGKG